MTIGDLPPEELYRRFSSAGLRARVGPFAFRLRTPIRSFVEDFRFSYADFPVGDESEVSDFRIDVGPAPRWRPWREPQARFSADGGSPFETFPRRISLPLAEWGLNWCIYNYAHQFLIFHSAVVEKAGRAAILAGPSGSGKSTLCAALLTRGWRAAVGRVRIGRSGARLVVSHTQADWTKERFHRGDREIARSSADRSCLRPDAKRQDRVFAAAHRSG